MAKMTLNPAALPRFTDAERARLTAMTPAEIEANAVADPDNPPLTKPELERMKGAQLARGARAAAGLSQVKFAKMFGVNVARVRDLEQGRFRPDSALQSYLKVIQREPEAVKRALGLDIPVVEKQAAVRAKA